LSAAYAAFEEYLCRLGQGQVRIDGAAPRFEPAVVLAWLSDQLHTDFAVSLRLYVRLAALQNLIGSDPRLARLVADGGTGGSAWQRIISVAAVLDVHVDAVSSAPAAWFNPKAFWAALTLLTVPKSIVSRDPNSVSGHWHGVRRSHRI
jgi:hypothetical protein